jgi:dinuclear metal center YbgI/SA1388 family protein
MKVRELAQAISEISPVRLAEKWDNVGLIIGDGENDVTGVATTLDVWPDTVEACEAVGANAIVAHHPPIFGGIKRITRGDFASDVVARLVERGIACIAAHTNADYSLGSRALAEKVGAVVLGPLEPVESASLVKLVVFVPMASADNVLQAIFESGGGVIGEYSCCSFSGPGEGTFKGSESTHPVIGKPGFLERVEERRLEVVMPAAAWPKAVAAMRKAHPYEEPAFDVIPTVNRDPRYGNGVVAEFPDQPTGAEFVERLKTALSLHSVDASGHRPDKRIRKCAFASGSAFECRNAAIRAGCAAFVTGEARYHELFSPAYSGPAVYLVGHGHSEAPIAEALARYIKNMVEPEGIQVTVLPPKYPSVRL